jgi:putative transferase (TIGR04331 family)
VVARFLVTTALEKTWPDDDVPVLFLGEWCRRWDRKSSWENRDAVVAPYHWDDRQKLYQDYLYLQALYEELLKELAAHLNEWHCVDHSIRYWRIIVGPWLGYFIQILFDRWVMLRQVLRDDEIAGVKVIRRNEGAFVPNDMAAFTPLFTGEEWNEAIYGQILDWLAVPIQPVNSANHALQGCSNTVSGARQVKRSLARLASRLSGIVCRENEYFFISSYLSIKNDLLLQAKLGQLPKLWRPVAVPLSTFDSAARQWQMSKAESNDEFAAIVRALLPTQIPIAYLEGYRALVSLTDHLPWPKRPKAIFTSNSFSADDVFKAWAASKVESGVPLVIGQHGGNYGMAVWGFTEDHQIAIADNFLTWGWTAADSSNITPVGNFKGFGKQQKLDETGVALLVEMTVPRQSYHMFSAPVAAGQWLDYFEDQCRFVEALSADLQNQLLVRLYASDFGLGQKQRWQTRFPCLQLDNGSQPMASLLKKTRIYVSTYNATTYLESLSLNFPTIIFWNPKHWELRDSALPYFEKLKSVGIFHETPESAAQQMAAVWNDVSDWWQGQAVQAARRAFCEHYARIPPKPLHVLEDIFRDIVSSRTDCENAIPRN